MPLFSSQAGVPTQIISVPDFCSTISIACLTKSSGLLINALQPLSAKTVKTLAILAMALMIVGLTGCIDNPDDSKQKVSSSISL